MTDQFENKKLLYTYWDNLPFITKVKVQTVRVLLSDPVRSFILRYLRNGKVDEFGKNHGLERRHAFSARELHDAFLENSKSNKEITIQNVHHHLNQLLEHGFIKEISKILEGRHYVRYFGRSAKIFDNPYSQELKEIRKDLWMRPLKKLVKKLNPNEDPEKIDETIDYFLASLEKYYLQIYTWMQENYEDFYQSNFDPFQFIVLSTNFANGDIELRKTRDKIMQWLKLDDLSKYPPISKDQIKEEENI